MDNYNWESRKILIAEDEETNFLFIEAILEDTKAILLWAKSGIEVIHLFKENNGSQIKAISTKHKRICL